MPETVIVGIVLFVTTNIDDVFLTMAFFADPGLRPRAIVAGKYAGIVALVAASAAAAVCAIAVSADWIALMGIAPLGLGIHRLLTAWWARARPSASNDDAAVDRGGSFLAQVASVAATMRRLSGVLLPWVLIALGLWILKDALPLIRPAADPEADQAAAEPDGFR
ncbi:MAG: hypothetical protein ACKOCN_02240 [Planctomycetaceae bacterium]